MLCPLLYMWHLLNAVNLLCLLKCSCWWCMLYHEFLLIKNNYIKKVLARFVGCSFPLYRCMYLPLFGYCLFGVGWSVSNSLNGTTSGRTSYLLQKVKIRWCFPMLFFQCTFLEWSRISSYVNILDYFCTHTLTTIMHTLQRNLFSIYSSHFTQMLQCKLSPTV